MKEVFDMTGLRDVLPMAALTFLLVLTGYAMAGAVGAVVATALSALIHFADYWLAGRLFLAIHQAWPVSERWNPELHEMVRTLAARTDLPMPRLYVIDSYAPNAFALGRNPENAAVAVTSGLLLLLNRNEMMGILAHQIAHVRHRDVLVRNVSAVFARLFSVFAAISLSALFCAGGEEDGDASAIGILLFSLTASVGATLIHTALCRSRERLADEASAEFIGKPEYLARALCKLHMESDHAPARTGGLDRLFSFHPTLEDRMIRLHAMHWIHGLRVEGISAQRSLQ
jgi:heat shock protein HtpX